MLLSNNKELFIELVNRIFEKTNIQRAFIEKDFLAISILKELVSRNEKFVFKGGTSLSVCQKVINRFSEDIDISYLDEHITVGQRKQIKQAFFDSIEAVSLKVSNADNIRSRRVFNRYLCPYVSLSSGQSDSVIVEWATQTPSFPIEEKTAQTIIGQYLESIGRDDLVKQYGLERFTVKTITKERTLVDKIFAICDYHISSKLDRQSRHIYDIHQLLPLVKLDDEFLTLFNRVKEYRVNLDTCYSAKDGQTVSSLLDALIEKGTYRSDYNNRTFPLLYDGVTYNTAISSIKLISEFLKKHNL